MTHATRPADACDRTTPNPNFRCTLVAGHPGAPDTCIMRRDLAVSWWGVRRYW